MIDCSAECRPDAWGCKQHLRHRPARTVTNSTEVSLQATIVPVQILATQSTTNITGEQCQESNGLRTKHEHSQFDVLGNFRENEFECQEKCREHCNAFHTVGCEDSNEFELEGQHDFDACECDPISSQDFLEFDNECGCMREAVDDPDQDVVRRINKQIYRSISDVLSDIVHRAISQSLEKTIDIE